MKTLQEIQENYLQISLSMSCNKTAIIVLATL